MKNTDLLCEIGLKYERNMGYQNMGGGQKYQSNPDYIMSSFGGGILD